MRMAAGREGLGSSQRENLWILGFGDGSRGFLGSRSKKSGNGQENLWILGFGDRSRFFLEERGGLFPLGKPQDPWIWGGGGRGFGDESMYLGFPGGSMDLGSGNGDLGLDPRIWGTNGDLGMHPWICGWIHGF